MPYQNNSPRWEFSPTDRASLGDMSQASSSALATVSDGTPIARSVFDQLVNTLIGLTPTYNEDGPFQEVIPIDPGTTEVTSKR